MRFSYTMFENQEHLRLALPERNLKAMSDDEVASLVTAVILDSPKLETVKVVPLTAECSLTMKGRRGETITGVLIEDKGHSCVMRLHDGSLREIAKRDVDRRTIRRLGL